MYPDKKHDSISRGDASSSHQQPQAISTSSRPPRRIYARPAMASVNTTNPYSPNRPPSPPATAYFSGFGNEDAPASMQREPTAQPDAQAHFAYSTTLRRHQVDSAGYAVTPMRPDFWADGFTNLVTKAQRAWDGFRGDGREGLLENGYGERDPTKDAEPPKEGRSGQFSSWSIEVRVLSV
jgi:P-type Ca2+ transporter type 2C